MKSTSHAIAQLNTPMWGIAPLYFALSTVIMFFLSRFATFMSASIMDLGLAGDSHYKQCYIYAYVIQIQLTMCVSYKMETFLSLRYVS